MSEPIILQASKTTLVSEIQAFILEKLHKFQEFKNYFDEQEAQRIVKIEEILAEVKSMGCTAINEDSRGAFYSPKPKALYKLKQSIDDLEARYLLSFPAEHTDDYQVDTNYLDIGTADIKPLDVGQLISKFHFCMPNGLGANDAFPSSYVFKFESGASHPINQTIKELWNFCLGIKGEDYRINVLADGYLQDGEYSTPFFTIRVKNITKDEEFFEREYKARITWSEDMTAILDKNKNMIPRNCDDDEDF